MHLAKNVPLKDLFPLSGECRVPLCKALDKSLFSSSAPHCHGGLLCSVREIVTCSSGLAPHPHPAVGHSSVQVSAKELAGSCLWRGLCPHGCSPSASFPLLSLPPPPSLTGLFSLFFRGFFAAFSVRLLEPSSYHHLQPHLHLASF